MGAIDLNLSYSMYSSHLLATLLHSQSTLCVVLPRNPTPHLRTSHCPWSGIFAYSVSEYRRYTVPGLTRPVQPARWAAEAAMR